MTKGTNIIDYNNITRNNSHSKHFRAKTNTTSRTDRTFNKKALEKEK